MKTRSMTQLENKTKRQKTSRENELMKKTEKRQKKDKDRDGLKSKLKKLKNKHDINNKVEFYDIYGHLCSYGMYVVTKNGVVFHPGSYVCVFFTDMDGKEKHVPVFVEEFLEKGFLCTFLAKDDNKDNEDNIDEYYQEYVDFENDSKPTLGNDMYELPYSCVVGDLRHMDTYEQELLMSEYKWALHTFRSMKLYTDAWCFFERLVFQKISKKKMWKCLLGRTIRETYLKPLVSFGMSERWDFIDMLLNLSDEWITNIPPVEGKCDACFQRRILTRRFSCHRFGKNCGARFLKLTQILNILSVFRSSVFLFDNLRDMIISNSYDSN